MKKLLTIAAVLAAALLAFSCTVNGDGGDNDKNQNSSEVDFGSHNTDYSILVRNNTGQALVAFKGDLAAEKLIGGIPAHAQNHGLPKNLSLFDKTEDFPLILLTEAQYIANKSNLQSQKNTPFTRVYVFFNKDGENTVVYELSDKLGGVNTLTLINAAQNINIEMRVNGVSGETLGYLPAGLLTTTLNLNNGNYEVFPVIKRYNRTRDTLDTIYPKTQGGDPWGYSLGFDGAQSSTATLNLKDMIRGLTLTSGAAQVFVNNQTTSGAVSFYEGTTRRETITGLWNIMPTTQYYFQFDMPKSGNSYADSIPVSNWKFGPTAYEVPLQVSESDTTAKGTFNLYRDKLYTVTVTGDRNNPASLHAWIDDGVPIDTSGFEW